MPEQISKRLRFRTKNSIGDNGDPWGITHCIDKYSSIHLLFFMLVVLVGEGEKSCHELNPFPG